MKLALASKKDFKLFWKIYAALDRLGYADSELSEERCETLLIGRLKQLGTGGLFRVFGGTEMFIRYCCKEDSNVYDLDPEKLKKALEEEECSTKQK